MKILVTGSAGRIGSPTTAALVARGHEVVPYDQKTGQDIFDKAQLRAAMTGCDMVVHLAAIPYPLNYPFSTYYHVNCDGVLAVAQAAVESWVKRLVFSSSTMFYGYGLGPDIPYPTPLAEEQPPATTHLRAAQVNCSPQRMCYCVSKIIAEQVLAYYGLTKLLETVVFRIGPVAPGKGATCKIVADAICKALEHPGPFWYEVFNIVEDRFRWANSDKAQKVLGVEL